jgi:hypothetical protein
MTIFGKKLSEYVAFQKFFLAAIAAVGILRLVLSLAGVSDSAVRWLSMTALGLVGVFYYGVTVHTKGFGSYRQLLPVVALQAIVTHSIVIVGILISAATGRANIFTAPEYGGGASVTVHVLAHLVAGMVVGPLIGWAIGSLVLFVTKKVSGPAKPAPAAA